MLEKGLRIYILGLWKKDELTVREYSDAISKREKDDYSSQFGITQFCLNVTTVSWKSSNQCTVANSTIDAKCIAFLMLSCRRFGSRSSLLNLM